MRIEKKILGLIVFLLFLFVFAVMILIRSSYNDSALRYTQEYIAGTGNIKGDVKIEKFLAENEAFAIGANSYGYAVFKDPARAFQVLQSNYQRGIQLIEKEFQLESLSYKNFDLYMQYGWQVTTGSKLEKEQAAFVTSFMDIYKNSFRKPIG